MIIKENKFFMQPILIFLVIILITEIKVRIKKFLLLIKERTSKSFGENFENTECNYRIHGHCWRENSYLSIFYHQKAR